MGDDDTSSFKAVVDSKPYEKYNITPTKLECVSYVQRRLGTYLHNEVKGHKSTSTPIGGRGQLHERTNSMQNFYGIAICQNLNDKYEMKKAIGAILFYCTDITDAESRHRFFPTGEESWYKYKKDKFTGKSTYKETVNLTKNGYSILYDQYLMHWQMTSYYQKFFMVRLRTQMGHLTTLFGQDVLRPFMLVGQ